jgi:hypothetical protein
MPGSTGPRGKGAEVEFDLRETDWEVMFSEASQDADRRDGGGERRPTRPAPLLQSFLNPLKRAPYG